MNKKNKFFFIESFDRNSRANIILKKPDKYREIEKYSYLSKNIITLGSNYSYAPLGFDSNSTSIDFSNFNRILDFNKNKKEITVEAGIKIFHLLDFTLKHQLWIPQIPGYPFISIGGMVATNSHGKSCAKDGTVRNSIKKIKLFHKENGWLDLAEDKNKDIFDLTIGGLGLTGTIVEVTFRLEDIKSNRFVTNIFEVKTFKESSERIDELVKESSLVYSWNRIDNVKNFGEGLIFKSNLTIEESIKEDNSIFQNMKEVKPFFLWPFSIWNKLSIRYANNLFFKLNKFKKKNFEEDFTRALFPYYGKETYFNFFGTKGFYESQILLNKNKVQLFFDEFLYYFKKLKPNITLSSIKKMSGIQSYLRFENNDLCVSFDFKNNKKSLDFMNILDSLCVKYNALPSLIKDSRLTRETLIKCYPYYQHFKQQLKNFDKRRIYKSKTSNKFDL